MLWFNTHTHTHTHPHTQKRGQTLTYTLRHVFIYTYSMDTHSVLLTDTPGVEPAFSDCGTVHI